MEQVTVTQFANMCGVSSTAIRKLILQGKLIAEKDLRGSYVLDLDDGKNRFYFESHNRFSQQVADPEQPVAELQETVSNEVIETLVERIENLAREAGQTQLLTDNLIQQKQDAEYWRNKFFELQYQNTELHNQITMLQVENNNLKKEVEEFKNKKFNIKFWK